MEEVACSINVVVWLKTWNLHFPVFFSSFLVRPNQDFLGKRLWSQLGEGVGVYEALQGEGGRVVMDPIQGKGFMELIQGNGREII